MPVKKLFIIFALAAGLLSACSKTEPEKQISYDWPPPVEELSWGMSGEEAVEALGLTDDEITWEEAETGDPFGSGEKVKMRWFQMEEPMEFLEEEVSAAFYFNEKTGLDTISFEFADKSWRNIEVDVQKKLMENYESSWGTMLEELDGETLEMLKSYMVENGTPEDAAERMFSDEDLLHRPLASYELNMQEGSPAYGSLLFHGSQAAMMEHVF